MKEINVYCDESCYLEHGDSNYMALGAIWCPKEKIKEINSRINDYKMRNGIKKNSEIKWTKISNTNKQMYIDIINYFFDDDDINFRGYIANKEHLNHEKFNQTHDEWYYKMYFNMLKVLFNKKDKYNIYVDIKDVHSYEHCQKLLKCCQNKSYDFDKNHILKIQPMRSNEIAIIQLADVLTGALCYRIRQDIPHSSSAKKEIVNLISKRSGYSLSKNTYITETKFNLFFWEGEE